MEEKDNKKALAGWLLLAVISILYFFSNLQKMLVPGATFNELMLIFPGADAANITRLGAAFLYPYAFMQLVTGILADRYSGTRVLFVGALLFCLGSIASAFTVSFGLLFASRLLTGAAAATIYLSAVKEISRLLPGSLAISIGALTLIGYTGATAGTTPFAIGLHRFGYFPMMIGVALALCACYLLFLGAAACSSRPPVCRDIKFHLSTYLDVLKIPHNNWICLINGCSFGVFFAIQSIIGKKYLEDFCGLTPKGASAVLMTTMFIAAVNGYLAAWCSRLIGDRRRPFFLFGGIGTMLGLLLLFAATLADCRTPALSIAAIIILTFAANLGSIIVASMREVNDENHFGTANSITNFIPYLVTAIFGGLIGRLLEVFPPTVIDGIKIYGRQSYLLVFALLALTGVGTLVAALNLKETNPAAIERHQTPKKHIPA